MLPNDDPNRHAHARSSSPGQLDHPEDHSLLQAWGHWPPETGWPLHREPPPRHAGRMVYDPELAGCFGERNFLFAVHPRDKQRAFQWLARLREHNAMWSDVQRQIEEFLRERGVPVFHILDQIERAFVLFKPWLYAPDNDE